MSSTTILENVIDERADMVQLAPETLDRILAEGWRLLGKRFVRHNFSTWRKQLCRTIPLRIKLADFQLSKSQRKVLRQNEDLLVISAPAKFDNDRNRLFDLHRDRFEEKQSTTLASFIHPDHPHLLPTEGRELGVYLDNRLIACSFFHLGKKAVSGTYCVFDPSFERRSLGTFTLLLELLMAQELDMEYYYHGYTHDIPSQFDYKLSLSGLEHMNWENGKWTSRERLPVRNWKALLKNS